MAAVQFTAESLMSEGSMKTGSRINTTVTAGDEEEGGERVHKRQIIPKLEFPAPEIYVVHWDKIGAT